MNFYIRCTFKCTLRVIGLKSKANEMTYGNGLLYDLSGYCVDEMQLSRSCLEKYSAVYENRKRAIKIIIYFM
jgi:hypothetical protein